MNPDPGRLLPALVMGPGASKTNKTRASSPASAGSNWGTWTPRRLARPSAQSRKLCTRGSVSRSSSRAFTRAESRKPRGWSRNTFGCYLSRPTAIRSSWRASPFKCAGRSRGSAHPALNLNVERIYDVGDLVQLEHIDRTRPGQMGVVAMEPGMGGIGHVVTMSLT